MAISNTPPFSVKLRIYPGAAPAQPDTWGVPQDISAYVRYPGNDGGQAINYSAGRGDEAARVDASRMDLTLDNRDGRFTTRNPYGPYYGQLKRGCPIQLAMVCGEDTFTRTVGSGLGTASSGQVWTAGASWSVTSNEARSALAANTYGPALLAGADLFNGQGRMTLSPSQVATGDRWSAGAVVRFGSNTSLTALFVDFNISGALAVSVRKFTPDFAGFVAVATSATLFTYAANDKIRMVWQADGAALRVKAWKPGNPALPDADEPATWSLVTTYPTAGGTKAGIISSRTGANTNVGMYVAVDDMTMEAVEFTGYVAQWPTDWDMTGNNAWSSITASGVMRRLQQGTGALKSALRRQLPNYSPTGYWPMEDGPQASVFGSAVAGVDVAYKSGATVQPAGDTSLTGGGPTPVLLNATASIRGGTNRRQTGAGFSAMFFAKLSSLPAAKTRLAQFRGTGRVNIWNIYIDQIVQITVEGIAEDGTVVVDGTTSFLGVFNPLGWTAYDLKASFAAGTLDWQLVFHQVGSLNYSAYTGSFATSGTCRVNTWQLGGGASDLNGTAFAHVWLGEYTLPFESTIFNLVSDGWRTEAATDRLVRIADESKLKLLMETGAGESLGPQRPGTFLDVAADAEEADYGILYEAGSGLGYRPRSARYNRPVHMALSVASGHLDEAPRAMDDDQRLRNDWTVSRDEGSSAQVYDDASVLFNALYDDSTQLNIATDDPLASHAGWRVYLGIQDDLRWPSIDLNLARSTDLIPLWRAAPYGFRMTVATGRSQMVGSEPDVIVEGFTASLWPHGWRISLNCSPARPWDVPLVDDTVGRVDVVAESGKITTAITAGALSFAVATTFTPYSTSAPPFDILVSGERMTVTSVSPATSPQTFTVLRGINGVNKPQAINASVYMAVPAIVTL